MRHWKNCEDLLQIFGVDTEHDQWAQHFSSLAEFGAIMLQFSGADYLPALEREWMRELHLSPLVFYSQLKRAARPLFMADNDVLTALGLELEEGEKLTVHALLEAISWAMREDYGEEEKDVYYQIKEVLNRYD